MVVNVKNEYIKIGINMTKLILISYKVLIASVISCCFFMQTAIAIGLESTEAGKALESGNLRLVKKFLEQERLFDNRENIIIVQGLHLAVRSGNYELIKYLDSMGWLSICKNEINCFPIHYSSSLELKKSVPLVKFFINKGFSPLVVDDYGMTPLHYASKRGNISVVKILCNLGVDDRIKNSFSNENALEIAKRYYSTGILSPNSKEEYRIRVGLKNVIEYLELGKCIKKRSSVTP